METDEQSSELTQPQATVPEAAPPKEPARRSFARLSAIISCWIPFAVTLLAFVVLSANQDKPGVAASRLRWCVFALSSLLVTGGFALGWVILVGIKAQGRKGILARALIGIVGNGLLICFAVASIITLAAEPKEWPPTPEARAVQKYGEILGSFRNLKGKLNGYAARQDGDTKVGSR